MKNRCYVFSFNRGKELENCLISLEKFAATFFDIVVIDDNSNNKETKEILKKYSQKFKIFYLENNESHRLGGLYSNMNFALHNAMEEKIDFILFIQDDMQVVRKIEKDDIKRIKLFFNKNTDVAQIQTCFLKKCHAKKDDYHTFLDKTKNAYFRPINSLKQPASFSDVGIFYVPRFLKTLKNFKNDEWLNNLHAKSNDIKMGLYAYPFMMWLPMPMSYRGKKRSFYHKLKEKLMGSGFHPYLEMCNSSKQKLFHRSIKERPYAENFLICPTCANNKFWSFQGGNLGLMELGGWRSLLGRGLNKLERVLSLFIKYTTRLI